MLFTRQQQIALGFLFFCIVILQGVIWFNPFVSSGKKTNKQEEVEWLRFQKQLPIQKEKTYKFYPFNPNFITDYRGYMLGMSVPEIDRLHQFRAQGKFVSSAKEFQQLTKVSDSLLAKIEPLFKFPEWVVNKKNNESGKSPMIKLIDLNLATREELLAVKGLGPVLSDRILQQKRQLGAFVDIKQLQWIYGISLETFQEIKNQFKIEKSATLNKLFINEATLKELMSFSYFNYEIAKQIVTYRTMQGNQLKPEDLSQIKQIPQDKLDVIVLYLQF